MQFLFTPDRLDPRLLPRAVLPCNTNRFYSLRNAKRKAISGETRDTCSEVSLTEELEGAEPGGKQEVGVRGPRAGAPESERRAFGAAAPRCILDGGGGLGLGGAAAAGGVRGPVPTGGCGGAGARDGRRWGWGVEADVGVVDVQRGLPGGIGGGGGG